VKFPDPDPAKMTGSGTLVSINLSFFRRSWGSDYITVRYKTVTIQNGMCYKTIRYRAVHVTKEYIFYIVL
jgi:hypothetical protein